EAKNNGTTAINNINPTGDKKAAAKKEIDQAAKAKKAEIDKRTDLTKEEKDKAKTDVDTAVTVAKKAIDDATTNDKVDEAKNNGKQLSIISILSLLLVQIQLHVLTTVLTPTAVLMPITVLTRTTAVLPPLLTAIATV
uniref:DUF1542 domain-containing protein n=1 Tax=Streptococcus sp. 202 TaxID=2582646 RepID=UPI0015667F7A